MAQSKYSKIARSKIDPIERNAMRKSLLIAKRIHELRRKHGYTQKDLSEKLGVQPSLVSKWLSGFHNITIETVEKMEAIFNEPILVVFFDEEKLSKTKSSKKAS